MLLKEKKTLISHLEEQLKRVTRIESCQPIPISSYKINFEGKSKAGHTLSKEFQSWLDTHFVKDEIVFHPEMLVSESRSKSRAGSFIQLEEGSTKVKKKDAFPWPSNSPKASLSSAKLEQAVAANLLQKSKIFQSTPNQPSIFSLMKTQDKSMELPANDQKQILSTVYTPKNVESILSKVRPLFKTQPTLDQPELETLSPVHKAKTEWTQEKQKRQVKPSLQGNQLRRTAQTQRTTSASFSGIVPKTHSELSAKSRRSPTLNTDTRLPVSLVYMRETVKF